MKPDRVLGIEAEKGGGGRTQDVILIKNINYLNFAKDTEVDWF